jgi:hypothetical protein
MLNELGVIDLLLMTAFVVVVPLGLRIRHASRQLVIGALVAALPAVLAVAMRAAEWSPAVPILLGLPWLAVAAVHVVFTASDELRTVRSNLASRTSQGISQLSFDLVSINLVSIVRVAGAIWWVVGASWLLLAMNREPVLGFGAPLVLLTSVHFHMAGFSLCALAGVLLATAPTEPRHLRERRLIERGTIVTLLATPTVAIGHLTVGWMELVGATVMAIGVMTLAMGISLKAARSPGLTGRLLTLTALGPALPMVLAIHYGINQVRDWYPLSYEAIAASHGILNTFAFLIPGLYAHLSMSPGPIAGADSYEVSAA